MKNSIYKIHLPEEYINKKVEILVLPLDEDLENKNFKRLKAISLDTKNFKFNREEANER